MAIATLAAYLAKTISPDFQFYFRKSTPGNGSNTAPLCSYFLSTPDAGSAPTAVAVCTDATVGGLPLPSIKLPGAGGANYLPTVANVSCQFGAATSGTGLIVLVDRILGSGGMDLTVTTEQTTNLGSFPALPARVDSGGAGLIWGVEVHTNPGAGSSTTFTVNYTNQAGTAARASKAAVMTSNPRAGGFFPICPQDGDTGIKSIQGVTLAAALAGAGNFGISAYRIIGVLGLTDLGLLNGAQKQCLLGGGVVDTVAPDACLTLMMMTNITNGYALHGDIKLARP